MSSDNPFNEGDDSVNTPEAIKEVKIDEEDVEDVDEHGDDQDEESEHDSYP